MRQAKVIVHVIQSRLLPYARLLFAQGDDGPTNGGDVLTDGEVDPLNEGRVDLPTTGR
jgi:hypothetical protein